jgi:probable F420-dependent oxidoreductase
MKIEASLMAGEYTETGAAAKHLEDLGFDTAIAFEGPHDPFMGLVLAAQATERIELATGVAIAFARNPMVVAQTANDLQRIARGRFILGIGTQIKPHIEKRFSMPWSKPAARMREFVQAIRAIWAAWEDDERLDFRGEFYTHTLMTPVFKPEKNPHGQPPIFLAAVGPKMVEVAGEVADGFIAHPLNSRDFALKSLVPTLERGFASSGRKREDFQISVQTITIVGDNDEQIEKGRQQAKAQLSFYGSTPAYRVPLDFHGPRKASGSRWWGRSATNSSTPCACAGSPRRSARSSKRATTSRTAPPSPCTTWRGKPRCRTSSRASSARGHLMNPSVARHPPSTRSLRCEISP